MCGYKKVQSSYTPTTQRKARQSAEKKGSKVGFQNWKHVAEVRNRRKRRYERQMVATKDKGGILRSKNRELFQIATDAAQKEKKEKKDVLNC